MSHEQDAGQERPGKGGAPLFVRVPTTYLFPYERIALARWTRGGLRMRRRHARMLQGHVTERVSVEHTAALNITQAHECVLRLVVLPDTLSGGQHHAQGQDYHDHSQCAS